MTLYDPIVSRKISIEAVLVKGFSNVTEIIRQMNNKWLPSTKGLSEIDFQYYLVKIEFNDLKIIVIGSFTSVYRIKRKMLISNFNVNIFKLNEYDLIIGFNRKIDFIIINDEYIFLNIASAKFDSLF